MSLAEMIVFEPAIPLRQQTAIWKVGYAIVAALLPPANGGGRCQTGHGLVALQIGRVRKGPQVIRKTTRIITIRNARELRCPGGIG